MSKKKLRPVMFDIDGVLADFTWGYLALAKSMGHGIDIISHKDVTLWNQYPFSEDDVWRALHNMENFWRDLPCLVRFTTLHRINEISQRRPVYFVTSRPHNADIKHQTEVWLRLHAINSPAVIITPRKGQIAAAIDAAYLLDDKAGNAVYTAYESPNTKAFLLDRKYNQFDHDVIGSKVQRVQTVEAFLDIVEADSVPLPENTHTAIVSLPWSTK